MRASISPSASASPPSWRASTPAGPATSRTHATTTPAAADLLGARGPRPDIGAVLAKHGEPLLLLGRDQEAEPLLVEALARQWALAIPRVQSDTLAALAILHAHNGRPRSAVALLGASAALAGPAHPLAIGGRPLPSADLHAATREALAPDDWQRAWDDGFRQPTRQIRRVISGAS